MPATVYRFTVDEYHRMGEAGIFHEDDRVELIDGQVVEMSPIGAPHAACVNRLTRRLVEIVGDAAIVSIQNPVVLGEHHEPQPDVVLLVPRADGYSNRLPRGTDVLLLIEVADTTLRHDRSVKLPIYARGGVPECWIVNLVEDVIEVYGDPRSGTYAEHRTVGRGSELSPVMMPSVSISADEILG